MFGVLELCCFEWFQNCSGRCSWCIYVLELCCFEWFQNGQNKRLESDCVLELCCFEWFQNLSLCPSSYWCVLELCCFEWFQNVCDFRYMFSRVLELCCFEWFQLTLKATHFLSSFFLIQVYILVVKNPFPCREARPPVLRITLPLLTSGWYYTSVFLLELER